MTQFPLRSALAASALLALVGAHASNYLNIGDPAPKLSHLTWLKGEHVGDFEKGKVYVIEFWATWCEPCKENIPNLTMLAKKYAGLASITGIGIWESTDRKDATYMKRVVAFVNKEGDKMDYNVASDDLSAHTANTWMKAAGEGGIPMTFVVGKDGKIAWMGKAADLDGVLAQVTTDKFDVEAARARRATEVELVRPVQEAMEAKHYAQALKVIDEIVAKHPEMARFHAYPRYVALAHTSLPKTKELSSQLIKDSGGEIGVYQMMSSVYATEPNLSPAAYQFGMSLIQDALAKNERQYMFLSMASAVSHFLHERPQAIQYAKEAIGAAEKDSHAPVPFVEFLKRNLQTLETSKKS